MASRHSGVAYGPLLEAVDRAYLADEEACVRSLRSALKLTAGQQQRIQQRARKLVLAVRREQAAKGGIEAFMHEYDLSSDEGVVLMCLAEALLRIPDSDTVDRLIRDKLTRANWKVHLGQSHSLFVNASTWGLMLTGRLVNLPESLGDAQATLHALAKRSGEPLVRTAIKQGMRIIAHQFVLGRSIEEAVERGRNHYPPNYRYSFDMLGEAALTQADADRYFSAYKNAISLLDQQTPADSRGNTTADGISVKLSALHPRYEFCQRSRVIRELTPRLTELAVQASQAGLTLTVDAEEADRLNLSLELFSAVYRDDRLGNWEGFGLAVQAYQKRAPAVIEWLQTLARDVGRRIPVRLAKGAYWDSEIKRAQQLGLQDYPVFTRKSATDLSYLVCAQQLFATGDCFYPQFASHNAHTIASLQVMAEGEGEYELQRLHGMGDALFDCINEDEDHQVPCRLYAPVGNHEALLPYLVRRLLENGANSSFVNRIEDEAVPLESIIADPLEKLDGYEQIRHPAIPMPPALYGAERKNSLGLNLDDNAVRQKVNRALEVCQTADWQAMPLVAGRRLEGETRDIFNPADQSVIGSVVKSSPASVEQAMQAAESAADSWAKTVPQQRANLLDKAAEQLQTNLLELATLSIQEGGRTIPDALSEVREAIDFFRYYAAQLRSEFAQPRILPGPTGEENRMSLHGRGLFICISPWNFPIAIFSGQIAAALAAGNTVIAKPASQTPLTAIRIVELLHAAGIQPEVVQLLPGRGADLGALLLKDQRVAGVAFTGSTETARQINQILANRPGPIVPLIAETGGQNAMIVDSSALPEQTVSDVIQSAFNSAGQRCSALRVLFLQEEIAPRIPPMLSGAMEELSMEDPSLFSTDVGPVIDHQACKVLQAHVNRMDIEGRRLYSLPLAAKHQQGSFFAPHLYEIDALSQLPQEVFGPILHVIRYPANSLDQVLASIRQTGYGLTLGIHSRIDETVRYIQQQLPIGNTYVNRNMIGAVVGVQPFGGEGLSGTGPKAGGPYTLFRYSTERSITLNTAAIP